MGSSVLVAQALSNILTQRCRIMIFAAANFAALRLEQLAGPMLVESHHVPV